MKRIVIYYSLTGNTRQAAAAVAEALHADLLALEPVKPIPEKGAASILTGGGQATFGVCPPLKPLSLDPASYDEIILGTPIWAGKCAAPVRTFLKGNPLCRRVTAVFTLSGSGKNDGCLRALARWLPNVRHTLSLCDAKAPQHAENAARLAAFTAEVLGGSAQAQ